MSRIFEPFYTSDDAQGSGLGLAIAHELAERMDGRARAPRACPAATTFSLELPRVRRRTPRGRHAAARRAARRRLRRRAGDEDDPRADDHDARRGPQGRRRRPAGRRVVRPVGDLPARVAGRRDDHSTGLDNPNGGGQNESGVGSGFVISGDGEIATNAHVVTSGEGASIHKARAGLRALQGRQPGLGRDRRLRPVLRRRAAEGRSRRPDAPAAAARLRARRRSSARRSRRSAARSARTQSLSVGVVSALDRSIDSLTGFATTGAIQTDAAINHGNSGGPLLDAARARARDQRPDPDDSGDGSGVGFAVSVDTVKRSLGQLRKDGKVHYSYLGVSTAPLYPQLAQHFKVGTDHGAWVQDVGAGRPGRRRGAEARRPPRALPGQRRTSSAAT